MKGSFVACLVVVQSVCFGSVRDELERLKSLPVPEWAAVRDRILKEGPACTNELAEIRNRPQESWEVRFIASLCLERLLNDPEETDFFRNPWKSDPEYNRSWRSTAAGYSFEEVPLLRRRLREKGYWFGLLNLFAFPDDCEDWHPVFRNGEQILYEDAPAEVRLHAARLSEWFSRETFAKQNWGYDTYIPWLEAYVLDGTYPEGSSILLVRYSETKHYLFSTLRGVLARNKDPVFLEQICDSFGNDQTARRLVARRLSELSDLQENSQNPRPERDSETNGLDGWFGHVSTAFNKQDQKEKKGNSAGLFAVLGIVVASFCAWKILRKTTRRDMRKGTPP